MRRRSFYIKSTEVTIDPNARFFNYSDDGKVVQQAVTQVYAEYQGQTTQIGYVAENLKEGGMKPSADYDYSQNVINGKATEDYKYAGINPIKWGRILARDIKAPDNAQTISDLQDVGAVLLTQLSAYSLLRRSAGVTATKPPATAPAATNKILVSFEDVSEYVAKNKQLPSNFITKEEAKALGWKPKLGNLNDVAPGKSIGGDIFKNAEGLLPKAEGRVWYEADINYSGGYRGDERLLYSNDGLLYKTTDHYITFTQIK